MVEIATSLLNVEQEKAIRTFYDLEVAKTDYFHIDVMDGKFVENDTSNLMKEYCEYLNSISNLPLDVHLMVEDIKSYIDSYLMYEPNIITFHYEGCKDKKEALEYIQYIKEKNCRAGIAISPSTKVEEIYDLLPYLHMVLIMTVEPGKGGQKIIESVIPKISQLKKYSAENSIGIDIEVDGGVTLENAPALVQKGADILVAGTAILLSKDYTAAIAKMKKE